MIILDSYLTANPRTDIKLLLTDEKAIDFFRRWTLKRKNHRDMFLNEKRNTLRTKTSFRRSVCSLVSLGSDQETKETLNFRRLGMSTGMEVCMEDPKEHFNENFGDLESSSRHNTFCCLKRRSEVFKELRT